MEVERGGGREREIPQHPEAKSPDLQNSTTVSFIKSIKRNTDSTSTQGTGYRYSQQGESASV